MKELPNAAYATILILSAIFLAGAGLLFPAKDKDVTMAVLAIAGSIITGAFGYIQGHKDSRDSATVTTTPSSTQVALNPTEQK